MCQGCLVLLKIALLFDALPPQAHMKPTMSLAVAGGALLLASQRSGAVPCTPSIASFVVDDTAGALQVAAALNCSGGTFNVSWVGSVTVEETIRVSEGSALSVVGTPDGSSVANGTDQVSLFEVIGGTLSLSSLSLVNGNGAGAGGGAISVVDSTLEINFCSFSDNAGDVGGGIFLENSVLAATDSIFAGNFAPNGALNFSDVTSSSSATSSSSSSITSHVTNFAGTAGGAIYALDSALTVENCTFSDNASHDGGCILLVISVLDASGSTFAGNSAYEGGAIFSARSDITISGDTAWDRNYAVDAGGAVHIDEGSTLNISGSSVWIHNSAHDSGGAIFVRNSTLDVPGNTFWEENSAVKDSGGAIRAEDSTVNISGNATWVGNSAVELGGAVSAEDCTVYISGDAVFEENINTGSWYTHGGGGLGLDTSSLEISSHVEFVGNRADNGGGLWASEFANITLAGSAVFEGNRATNDGGGFFLGYGSRLEILDTGSVHFSNNAAVNYGGGVFCDTAVFSDVGQAAIFTNNSANTGAGIYLGDSSSLILTGDNTTLSENSACSRGGGIYAEATMDFRVENSTFVSNFAGTDGGAMSLLSAGTTSNAEASDEAAVVSYCRFAENEASESGGAAAIVGGFVEMFGCNFDGNIAGTQGISVTCTHTHS